MDGSLFERGKTLENNFFRERDQQLVDKLRAELKQSEAREALAKASGISDDSVLDAMLASKVTAESLTGISLVPLVTVAWADGVMEAKEIAAITEAATQSGIAADSAAHGLLKSWLDEKPSADLLTSWKEYVSALKESLDEAAFGQLKSTVIGRARQVADAAGGILGFGKTSDVESSVIDDLEKAFG